MRIALIARSTLFEVPGGDTVQVRETARYLNQLGARAEVCLTNQSIDPGAFDLFHFFNITRPADILFHTARIKKPFVISPLFIDYSEYDRHHRGGIPGRLLRLFPADTNEYIKTVSRTVKGSDVLQSRRYLWKGQRKSIREILQRSAWLLPNAVSEYKALEKTYGIRKPYTVVPNGIDPAIFRTGQEVQREADLVICAARIEGIKNQLNLIRALDNTGFRLMLIGSPAPNQQGYYTACRKAAGANVIFTGLLSQQELAGYYARAKVHVLPSWFETCGLSSLEAAAMGCTIVITDRGYTRDYFGEEAYYCDPGDPGSIRRTIEKAAAAANNTTLSQRIRQDHTWEKAAAITLDAYQKILTG